MNNSVSEELDAVGNEEYSATYGSKKAVKLASKLHPIINKVDLNKSIYFIAPLIGITASYYNIINSYLGDQLHDVEDKFNAIYINVKYIDEKLTSNSYYLHHYKLEDHTYMYKFMIPEEFENDYLLFCESKYSKMSNNAKIKLCKMTGVRNIEDSVLFKVLYKTPDRIQYIEDLIGEKLPYDAEVLSAIDLDKEIYDRR